MNINNFKIAVKDKTQQVSYSKIVPAPNYQKIFEIAPKMPNFPFDNPPDGCRYLWYTESFNDNNIFLIKLKDREVIDIRPLNPEVKKELIVRFINGKNITENEAKLIKGFLENAFHCDLTNVDFTVLKYIAECLQSENYDTKILRKLLLIVSSSNFENLLNDTILSLIKNELDHYSVGQLSKALRLLVDPNLQKKINQLSRPDSDFQNKIIKILRFFIKYPEIDKYSEIFNCRFNCNYIQGIVDIMDCLDKHNVLFQMQPSVLKNIITIGIDLPYNLIRIFETLAKYPELRDTNILEKFFNCRNVKNPDFASKMPTALEILGEYPVLQNMNTNLLEIIISFNFQEIRDILNIFAKHPILLNIEIGVIERMLSIQNINVSEILKVLSEHPNIMNDFLKKEIQNIEQGLEFFNTCFPLAGQSEIEKLLVKCSVANKAINIIFENNSVMKERFQLKEEYLIHFINKCESEKISLKDMLAENKFIKNFLSRIFLFQENEILKNINPELFLNRELLVQYFETLNPKSYVIEKLKLQAQIWKKMGENEKLKNFPFNEIWRFVIDGEHETKGAYFFEDEPGYIIGAFEGFLLALDDPKFLSLDHYDLLHNTIIDGVYRDKSECGQFQFEPFQKGFATHSWHFKISNDSDEEGLKDLIHRGKTKVPFIYVDIMKKIGGMPINNAELKSYVEAKFTKMKSFIEGKSPVMRLIAYSWLARELELMHILPDANGRTSMILLYQFIANDPDIPMIIFHNPNILEANGPEKIVYRLIEAMVKFKDNGIWTKEDQQQIESSLFLKDLQLTDPEIAKFRDLCIQELAGKPWSYFHEIIEGDSLKNSG